MKYVNMFLNFKRYIKVCVLKNRPYSLYITALTDDGEKCIAMPVADKKHARDIVDNASSVLKFASGKFLIHKKTGNIINF